VRAAESQVDPIADVKEEFGKRLADIEERLRALEEKK